MVNNKTISVVIPCHNEEESILHTLSMVPKEVDEVIVVDNLSSDRTASNAREAGATVVLEENKGYGYAIKAGIRSASGDVVIVADGDGTYPFELATTLASHLVTSNLEFISCSRFPLTTKESMSPVNVLGTKILNLVAFMLYGVWFRDILSGMWVFKREAVTQLDLVSNDWNLSEEIKIEAARKTKFKEVHINHNVRLGETKLMKWYVGLENLVFLFWKRFFPTRALPTCFRITQYQNKFEPTPNIKNEK